MKYNIKAAKQLLKEIFDSDTDPVKRCPVYLDKKGGSCSHVDGPICDWPDCSIVEKYRNGTLESYGLDKEMLEEE